MKKIVIVFIVISLLLPGILWAGIDGERGIFAKLPRGVSISEKTVYIILKWIDYVDLSQVFYDLNLFNYNKISIDLFSYGGSVFDALAIVGLLEEQERQGKIIEIRAKGIVASGGLIIMVAGTKGNRYLDKRTFIMFHELQSYSFGFKTDTPTSREDEAKIFRFIQDGLNEIITSKSKISLSDLEEKIKRKELWISAKDAIEYGFADKIIGE